MDPLSGSAVAGMCHMMVETMPVPAVIYDAERIVYSNAACHRMLGAQSADEVTGHSIFEFVHPDARQAAAERTRLVIESGARLSQVENRLLRVDGKEVRFTFCSFPIRFGDIRLAAVFVERWDTV